MRTCMCIGCVCVNVCACVFVGQHVHNLGLPVIDIKSILIKQTYQFVATKPN